MTMRVARANCPSLTGHSLLDSKNNMPVNTKHLHILQVYIWCLYIIDRAKYASVINQTTDRMFFIYNIVPFNVIQGQN